MMNAFIYNAYAARVVFGAGSLKHLEREIDTLGYTRALVLSTPEQRDSAEMVATLLGPRAAGVFDRAAMHVPIETAREAREVARLGEVNTLILLESLKQQLDAKRQLIAAHRDEALAAIDIAEITGPATDGDEP